MTCHIIHVNLTMMYVSSAIQFSHCYHVNICQPSSIMIWVIGYQITFKLLINYLRPQSCRWIRDMEICMLTTNCQHLEHTPLKRTGTSSFQSLFSAVNQVTSLVLMTFVAGHITKPRVNSITHAVHYSDVTWVLLSLKSWEIWLPKEITKLAGPL